MTNTLKGLTKRPQKNDIVFVIDTRFQNVLDIAKSVASSILDYISISPSTSRISMVALHGNPEVKFHFKSFVNRECVLKAIKRLKVTKNDETTTMLSLAALVAAPLFDKYPRYKARKRIIYIVSNDLNFPAHYAYRHKDITSYAVVVGTSNKNLKHLVSTPVKEHLVFIKSKSDVWKVEDVFQFEASYTECDGSGQVHDECNRICDCVDGRKTNCYRLRKEVSRLSSAERKRLYGAIWALGMTPKYKDLHRKFVWVHENYMCTNIHNEDHFNPWHRWYIILFENTLREFDCRITVPYWDWSYWVEKGDLFNENLVWRSGDFELGGNGNAERLMCVQTGAFRQGVWDGFDHEKPKQIISKTLGMYSSKFEKHYKRKYFRKLSNTNRCLRRYFTNSSDIKPASTIDKMLGVPEHQFRDIMLYLRYRIHGSVHMAVAGTMGSSWSADTPAFWLHHTFLDKIWWLWQQRGENFKNAYYGTYDRENMFLWPYKQKDMIDVMNLPKCIRYKYDLWPKHKIVPFHDLDSSKFKGKYMEKSVCDDHKDYEKYQDYMATVFPDVTHKFIRKRKHIRKRHSKIENDVLQDKLSSIFRNG